MNIKQRIEELERSTLSPYAMLSCNSRGRETEITSCDMRTEYQRDRDRIIHCKSFRRLKHKTQVFLAPNGDHYRTRLTHTLEVSQVARTIARALKLNEDLTEAIALGHDLGHTPFGHAGERALAGMMKDGFSHNQQSLRVVDVLEPLNLTYEVRDGILCHTGKKEADTLEGRIVRISDRIAYINHDIDDAVRAGIITANDLPKEVCAILGDTHGKRIDTLIRDVIQNSQDKPDICMSPRIGDVMNELREYMFANIYSLKSEAKKEELKAEDVVCRLFEYYAKNLDKLPKDYSVLLGKYASEQLVCDYIAGMTDRYATEQYIKLFIPTQWGK
ncbi:MAG: deoxyguanosinetriphosphate triphosphohydrolase [Clostridia bacterium]|nr:deoxyguanosinetriphosphate triphosphohydrolase [Clostridia bacterium]